MGLLALASSMLAIGDPRDENPFARLQDAEPRPATAVETFLEIDDPAATALLAAMTPMIADELTRARAQREVASRAHPLPRWLRDIDQIQVVQVVEMVHVLGDGDNVFLDVRVAGGAPLTVVVYIDHNLGTLVKDAFTIPEPLDDVLAFYQHKVDDRETTFRPLDPPDARVRITQAIATAARTFPRYETDSWPMSRALVEWVVRQLPAGGAGYEFHEWTDEELAPIVERFMASPFVKGVTTVARQHADLLFWFAANYGPGDPLKWSPMAVERVLLDLVPRKVIASEASLRPIPKLVAAIVQFTYAELGLSAELLDDALDAVDQWTSEYLRLIASDRLQGAEAIAHAALAASRGDGNDIDELEFEFDDDGFDEFDDIDEPGPGGFDLAKIARDNLARLQQAYGSEALAAVTSDPLPDEPFDGTGIPSDIREEVDDVLAVVEDVCARSLGPEILTASRRLLAAAATGNPTVFRQNANRRRSAAAIVWAVASANHLIGRSSGQMLVRELLAEFDLTGSVSQRGGVLIRASGVGRIDARGGPTLADVAFLTGSRRAELLSLHDALIELADGRE